MIRDIAGVEIEIAGVEIAEAEVDIARAENRYRDRNKKEIEKQR